MIIFICVDHCHCTPVSLMPFALFFFQAPACPIMLSRLEDLPEHHAVHPDVPPAEMAVREMETDRVLTARDIFGVVAECGAVFCHPDSRAEVDRAAGEQWEEAHAGTPTLPPNMLTEARTGYQCMVGAIVGGQVGGLFLYCFVFDDQILWSKHVDENKTD